MCERVMLASINETLKFAGVHLKRNCFSHVQLYVAYITSIKPPKSKCFIKGGKNKQRSL